MKTLIFLFSLLLGSSGLRAEACGFCGGDKSASSVELIGEGAEADFNRAVQALKKIKGIYPKTVRSAFAQKAVSFVYKPNFKFDELAAGFSRTMPGWSMKQVEQIK